MTVVNKYWFLLLLVFPVTVFSQQVKQNLPNIIFIYADDLGYAELGCYGQQKIKTPNIDKMAEEGMIFTQHYSSAPVCAPARCMLMTGKHGGHSYIRGNYELGGFTDSTEGGQMPLPEGIFTLPKMLRNAGYTTALTGKWGLGMNTSSGSPLKQGFDYYYGFLDQKQAHNYYPTHLWENDTLVSLNNPVINVHSQLDSLTANDKDFDYFKGKDYAPAKITEKALDFIAKNKTNPFFLYIPYTLPHLSLQIPDEYVNKYIGQFQEKPYYGQKGYAASKYPFSTYAAMIAYLDEQVGIIIAKIKELRLDVHTLIMFSSDNGATFTAGGIDVNYFQSQAGLKGYKRDLYEGGIRIPFIARWPKMIPEGTTSDLISVQYDVMATLAELTHQKLTLTDGISFLPELLGNTGKQIKHEYIYFEYPENGGQVSIRMGDWKAIRINVRKQPNSPWRIFNLKTDRNETTDVAMQHPELIKFFNAIQKKEHECPHIIEWEFIDPKFPI